jgi:hypothetical protein
MRAGDETFEAAARARVAGEIDDDEFLRRTWRTWVVVTGRLWRRWRRKLPVDVGPDDVQQALMLEALEYVEKCDPARLTARGSYGGYIVWCASRRTTRQIHRWRNARGERGPGRFERNFASLTRRDDDRREDYESRLAGDSPDPVESIEAGRAFREHLGGSSCVREALVLLALQRASGSVDGAAEEIWDSYAARIECGARDIRHARRIVRDVLGGLTDAPPAPRPDDELFEVAAEPEPLWKRALAGRARELDSQPAASRAA